MKSILDGIVTVLAFFNLVLFFTGGTILKTQAGKIELSSLDAWVLGLLLLAALRSWLWPKEPFWIRGKWDQLITWLLDPARSRKAAWIFLCASILALTLAHALRHLSFGTHAYDLIFLHQPLFNPLGPPFLRCDLCMSGTYLGDHLSPTLALPALLTQVLRSDYFVFALQSLVMGGAIYLGLRHGPLRKRPELWFWSLVILFCERALRGSVVWDFREDHLGFAWMIGMLLSLDRGRLGLYFLFFGLTLLTKENFPLILLFMPIPILWDKSLPLDQSRRKLAAVLSAILAISWTLIGFKILIPALNQGVEAQNNIVVRLGQFGNTPGEILVTLLTSPAAWWTLLKTQVLKKTAFKYLLYLFLPLIYFLRRSWIWVVPALPGIAMNLVSQSQEQLSHQFHYELAILPFLFFGAWKGMATPMPAQRRKANWGLAVVLALCASGRWPLFEIQRHWPSREQWTHHRYLKELPAGGIVAAELIPMAQMSQMASLRQLLHFELPAAQASPEQIWEAFAKANQRDRTGIPGHNALEANRILLDLRSEWQSALAQALRAREWRELSRSADGSFAFYERPVRSAPAAHP